MANFDRAVWNLNKENFNGYQGDAPTTEAEYNAVKDDMFSENAPTWAQIETEMDNYVDPASSGNQKLLDLGLTQAEATALTGYKPEE